MPALAVCPPPLELESFLLGRLDEVSSLALESHLANCAACQQQLTTLAAEDTFVRSMRVREMSSPTSPLNEAPEELVKLLVPHFKQIANSTDETATITYSRTSADTSTSFATKPQIRADNLAATHRFSTYEIRGVLGSGGMGTVLDAYDPLLKRSVAIKVVHSKLLAEEGMKGRLVREAQAAAAVEHDNIVTVFAVEMHEDAPCIVMPRLRGMTLKQRLEDTAGPLPVAEIVRIGREAASGLAAAHAGGLIHCDIKPANLWLETPRDRVKVLDFGLAVIRGTEEADAEGISGTPGYLAPEQVRGEPLDQRTDIFSLGCVLYRMATGQAPFTGEPHLRTLWTVLSESPAPAAQLNPLLPQELGELIDRMLERDPIQRPACTTAVLETLNEIDRRLVDRRGTVVRQRWIAALILVALLSGSSVGWWALLTSSPAVLPVKVTFRGDEPSLSVLLRHEGQQQTLTLGREKTLDLLPGDYTIRPVNSQHGRSLVPDQFSVIEGKQLMLAIAWVGEITLDTTHTQPVTGVAVMPESSGTTVVSVGLDRTLVAWDSSSSQSPQFVNLPHAARCLAVSPNGMYVATAGGNKQPPAELAIRLWQTVGLVPHGEPLTGHTRMIQALAYSPDGTLLASAGADGIFLWDLSTGESLVLATTEAQTVFTLAFSANGERLLTGSDEGQIVLWDVSSRAPLQTHTASRSAVRAVAFLDQRLVAAGDDGVIRIWNDGALQHEWLGDGKAVVTLAVAPNFRQLISGNQDGTISVWSVTTGQTMHVLRGHTREVNSLVFSGNGRQAVSGGADGIVRWWQLPFSD